MKQDDVEELLGLVAEMAQTLRDVKLELHETRQLMREQGRNRERRSMDCRGVGDADRDDGNGGWQEGEPGEETAAVETGKG